MGKVELLAPAGDIKSFYSAINNGADAIYLGLNTFNARAKAENFNTENIKDVVREAHFKGVKVYLTVNILIKDEEFNELKKLIQVAIDAKIDAFIIQDLGVVKFLKDNYPSIVLHASTQMGIHNLYGAKVAESLGFSRVVLSRETRLQDIIEIKQNTNLEIEFFVQGALCTCFSGNCYISSILSNESGNRGRCLQYCRMKYDAYDNDKKINAGYLLSAKDLSLIDNLKKLIDAGVCSFKIEGRLRRAGYVAKTVEVYRNALDNINQNKQSKVEDKRQLKKVFVRGDYNYNSYLDAENNNIIEINYNNHSGIKIGKVVNVSTFKDLYKIEISSNEQLSKGDGLKFYSEKKEIASLGVGNIEKLSNGNFIIYSKTKVYRDNNVNLILDSNMEEEGINKQKFVKVSFWLSAIVGSNLKITAKSNECELTYESDFVCEKAKNQITSIQEIEEQLNKTKDLGFKVEKININKDEVFIPKSVLNSIRRNSLILLKENIIKNSENNIIINKNINKTTENINFNILKNDIIIVKNISQIKKYLKNNRNKYNICLKPEIYDEKFILNFEKEIKTLNQDNFILYLPSFADYKDLDNLKTIISKLENPILMANNIYGLYFLNTYKVIAGYNLNVYNNYAVNQINDLGCIDFVSSVENFIGGYEYSFGYYPLMTFMHCPFKLNYNVECNRCSYNRNLNYVNNNRRFKIARLKNVNCQFELLNSQLTNLNSNKSLIDITNVDS